MSLYGDWKAATIAANQTDSDEVDVGRDFDYLEIQIPALDACTIKLQTAEKTGDTFRDLGDGEATESGTHNYHDVFNLGGYQFIRIKASANQSAGETFKCRGFNREPLY